MDTYILKIKDPVTGRWLEVPALKGEPGADNTYTAEYGATTYAEIIAAYNAGKVVKCHRNTDSYEIVYELAQLLPTEARFSVCSNANVLYYATCKSTDAWANTSYNLELSVRKVNDITASSTTTQYPSAKAVYDHVNNHHDTTKQDVLTPGENITIENGVISATGGGGGGSSMQEVFVAEYGETTLEEVNEAFLADKICICRVISRTYYAVTGGSNSAIFVWHGASGQKRAISVNSTGWSDEIDCNTLQASNKATEITSSSTDTQIPSAKAVYDFVMSLDSSEVLY